MWAIRAHKFASTHTKLLCTEDTTKLRLTRHDEEILAAFNDEFVGFELDVVPEESLKSERAKEVRMKGFFADISPSSTAAMARLHRKIQACEELRLRHIATNRRQQTIRLRQYDFRCDFVVLSPYPLPLPYSEPNTILRDRGGAQQGRRQRASP